MILCSLFDADILSGFPISLAKDTYYVLDMIHNRCYFAFFGLNSQ